MPDGMTGRMPSKFSDISRIGARIEVWIWAVLTTGRQS